MDLKLVGKKVFVSASSSGIGNAVARLFLAEGAWVVINGQNQERLLAAEQELRHAFGNRVSAVAGDMKREEEIARVGKVVLGQYHGIDILIPNLGSGKAASNDALAADEWRRFYEINVLSSLNLIRTFLPAMQASREGAIVVLASLVGIERTRAPMGYAAAKSALLTLVKNLSAEVARYGIRINAVAPGNIFFPGGRWEEILTANPSLMETYIGREVPLGRLGTPEEVAAAVVFLASPLSSFTTGATFMVDGGEARRY